MKHTGSRGTLRNPDNTPLGSRLACPHVPAKKDPAEISAPLPHGRSCATLPVAGDGVPHPLPPRPRSVIPDQEGSRSTRHFGSKGNKIGGLLRGPLTSPGVSVGTSSANTLLFLKLKPWVEAEGSMSAPVCRSCQV